MKKILIKSIMKIVLGALSIAAIGYSIYKQPGLLQDKETIDRLMQQADQIDDGLSDLYDNSEHNGL